MKALFAAVALLFAPLLFAQDALEEGALPAASWEGVSLTNPGEFRASVVVSLRRGEQLVEQTPLELAPGETRTIRIDRLFAASADGATIAFRSSQRIVLSGYRGAELTPAAGFIVTKRRSVRSGSPAPVIVHRTVVLNSSKDNTLYEVPDGSVSNGAGPHLFAGRTANGGKRRGLIAFNVTSQIPAGATVTRVSLRMNVSASRAGSQKMELHRVTKDWGEGASNAGAFGDGRGTDSKNGDATWLHTFFPNQRWTNAGGDFDAAVDAATTTASFEYVWESPAMIARVQQWLDQPATNFGWLILGSESVTSTKRFDSRELEGPTHPALTIEFDAKQ